MKIILIPAIGFALGVASPAAAGQQFWKTFADVGAVALPAAATVITLSEHDKNGLYQLTETGFIAVTGTMALKYGVNSERPNGGDHSFPSGHTAVAFASAGYLHARYGWKTGLPFEILAATIGFARVQSKDHHWYDVVAGAAIGEGSAFLFTRRLNQNVRVSAAGDTSGGLISLSARF